MFTPPAPRPVRRDAGFTLIELLVVIAIIAILTAIIFPVFATLRENARQKTSMANLESIQKGIAQFKLDQGRPPAVLFGYALRDAAGDPSSGNFVPMSKALAQAQADGTAQAKDIVSMYFPGLYPEYITDPNDFTDANNPNNNITDTSTRAVATAVGTNKIDGAGSLSDVPRDFYVADAYDISPAIDATRSSTLAKDAGGNLIYVPRYQTSWTSISSTNAASATYGADPGGGSPFYNRQLRWTNPPADTYVTATTYHVPNDNKVLVIWESGAAKAVDATRFLNAGGGSDSPSVAVTAPGGNSPANFWKTSPNHP